MRWWREEGEVVEGEGEVVEGEGEVLEGGDGGGR